MLLQFVLELLCSIILATDTSEHSASLSLGSAELRYSHALWLLGIGEWGEKGSFDDRKMKWNVDRTDHTRLGKMRIK